MVPGKRKKGRRGRAGRLCGSDASASLIVEEESAKGPERFKYFGGGKVAGITMPRLSRISSMISNAFTEYVIPDEEGGEDLIEDDARKSTMIKEAFDVKKDAFRKGKRMVAGRSEEIARPADKNDPYNKLNELLSESGFQGDLESLPQNAQLACVAIFSKSPQARLAAVKKAGSDPELLSIICQEAQYQDSSQRALDGLVSMSDDLNSPKALSMIASRSDDKAKRLDAVRRIKDIGSLLDIAYGSRFEDSRWIAISMLRSMGIEINEVDLKHDDTLVGSMQRLIKSSVKREEIIEEMGTLIDNVNHLENLQNGGKHQEYTTILKDNISSYKGMIQNIAISSRYEDARNLAIKGLLSSPESLMEVAQHAEYEETADLAISALSSRMDRLKDPAKARAIVASLAKEDSKRNKALERIDEERWLRHIIRNTRFEEVKVAAATRLSMKVDKLEEPESLRMVLAFCADPRKRTMAEKRASELASKTRALPQKRKKAIEEIKKDEDPFSSGIAPDDPWGQQPFERPAPVRPNAKGKGIFGIIRELIGL